MTYNQGKKISNEVVKEESVTCDTKDTKTLS